MSRPLLLDLFCGAGGCAVGYHRAGFDVVGVDIVGQPRYPFPFHQGDALEELASLLNGYDLYACNRYYQLREFSVIHASPPCQRYSIAANIHGSAERHPDLVEPCRRLLTQSGCLWVIENVVGAPLHSPVQICGLALGLNVKRHRWFESNFFLWGTDCRGHKSDYRIVFGGGARKRGHEVGKAKGGGPSIRRPHCPHEDAQQAMGIDWMNRDEMSQAVPPAYTEHLGKQLIVAL